MQHPQQRLRRGAPEECRAEGEGPSGDFGVAKPRRTHLEGDLALANVGDSCLLAPPSVPELTVNGPHSVSEVEMGRMSGD